MALLSRGSGWPSHPSSSWVWPSLLVVGVGLAFSSWNLAHPSCCGCSPPVEVGVGLGRGGGWSLSEWRLPLSLLGAGLALPSRGCGVPFPSRGGVGPSFSGWGSGFHPPGWELASPSRDGISLFLAGVDELALLGKGVSHSG